MSFIEAVKRANAPREPEHSARLRVAATLAVLVSIGACSAEGEISRVTAFVAGALLVAGMAYSYTTRVRPPGYIKVAAALAAVAVLAWFVSQVTGRTVTDITTVEDPLTVLFMGIQVVHSFHVPSRRDLLFSFGGAGGLMAVAGAQAIDLSFGLYAVAWFALTLWGLTEMWRSTSGGGTVSRRALGSALAGVCVASVGVFVLLPAPRVALRVDFRARAGNGSGPIPVAGALAGDGSGSSSLGSSSTQLSKPGSPAGRTRVGGYLGFANSLDTALRGTLGNTLIMRVRAEQPTFWIGETFDRWDGQSWSTTDSTRHTIQNGSPFYLPPPGGDIPTGQSDLQTFYMAGTSPDLIFHADSAREVWFPTPSIYFSDDGTIVSPIGLGRGAIYTVESDVQTPTPELLRVVTGAPGLPQAAEKQYTELPHQYPAVKALAQSVTAGARTRYDQVEALIGWIGAHTHYSTSIPPLPAGADTVDDFLFGSRTGFCEQISTSLAVMLRSLGVPAREAVGYVPGEYDPLTDLYEVRAKDAHAWVQVYFPGIGWESFDPTAVVPAANPSPGATALKDVGRALAGIPPVPAGTGGAVLALAAVVAMWRRSRPGTWDEAVAREMERAGRRCRRPRAASETLLDYAAVLDGMPGGGSWSALATEVAAGVYGGPEPPVAVQREAVATARRLRGRRA